jgi:hypothetical protein
MCEQCEGVSVTVHHKGGVNIMRQTSAPSFTCGIIAWSAPDAPFCMSCLGVVPSEVARTSVT